MPPPRVSPPLRCTPAHTETPNRGSKGTSLIARMRPFRRTFRDPRSSAPCRIGYLFLPISTRNRDLPTYPEPPSGRYGTYLPTYPARPAITTAVTSHVMSLHHFSTDSRRPTHCFSLAAGAGKNRMWADFARAPSPIRRGLPSLALYSSALSACVRRISPRATGSHERAFDRSLVSDASTMFDRYISEPLHLTQF